jgi:hypothetical protein
MPPEATMTEKKTRRRFSAEFKQDAVCLVLDRGLSIAQVARDLDVAERVGSIDRRNTLCPTAVFCGGGHGANGGAWAVG